MVDATSRERERERERALYFLATLFLFVCSIPCVLRFFCDQLVVVSQSPAGERSSVTNMSVSACMYAIDTGTEITLCKTHVAIVSE